MPRKNTVRIFVEEGLYHVYNRGVEKRIIFMDDQDYSVFLHLLKYYLSPVEIDIHPLSKYIKFSVIKPKPLSNIEKEVDLIEYCLMPNHFHLILKQHTINGITKLLVRILTTYAMYFNNRYQRIGYLFQGPYRSILIENDAYLLHLSRYIHLNPSELKGCPPFDYPYSSYKHFVGIKHSSWLKPNIILDYFNNPKSLPFLNKCKSYQEFIERYPGNSKEILGRLSLE
jgi:putative transposase